MSEITIIGGGLAGLSLGICLRRRGVPVTVHEAGTYPRHRVCGEFISGAGIESLRRMGLLEPLERRGARWASSATFFSTYHRGRPRRLPMPALCVSRLTLDSLLADFFTNLGGMLRCRSRWSVGTAGEGIVRASGRQSVRNGSVGRWFGLKAHARHIELESDLEMHFSNEGYVGLCRLPHQEVNVCGLYRRNGTGPAMPAFLPDFFGRKGGESLRRRLSSAVWDEASICSMAGLSFHYAPDLDSRECRVGDSFWVTPPFTGNGMSMAFESAELAASPLSDYCEGHLDWSETCELVRQKCEAAIGRRIRCANGLHALIFQPTARRIVMPLLDWSDWLWQMLFAVTRN